MKYSEKVLDHFRNPRNYGTISDADATGEIGNPECGDLVKLFLKIDPDHKISKVTFQSFGCPAAIACSSVITEMAIGMHIDAAEKITKRDVANALDGLPPQKMSCSNISADALRLAIREYKKKHGLPIEPDAIEEKLAALNLNPATEPQEITLDLQGKECPMTFVYTKVALEKMPAGQILKIILDYPPSFTNVPESVKRQKLGEIIKESDEVKPKVFWIKRI